MTESKTIMALVSVGMLSLSGGPALAHHSYAMFDDQKNVTLEGIVKGFQWTNPHSWVLVVVKDSAGANVEWSIEASSPNVLSRRGWTHASVKPGDKISITIHPLKDGSIGGSLVSAIVNGVAIGSGANG